MRGLLIGLLLTMSTCGGGTRFDITVTTQTMPYVHRVEPAQAGAGENITVYGFGFSAVAANNIISIGGYSAFGETYALVDPPRGGEVEAVMFAVPSGVAAGEVSVFVTVFEYSSNADITLTIE